MVVLYTKPARSTNKTINDLIYTVSIKATETMILGSITLVNIIVLLTLSM